MTPRAKLVLSALTAAALAAAVAPAWTGTATAATGGKTRYLVVARSDQDAAALKAEAKRQGAVVHDLGSTRTMAVEATPQAASALRSSGLASTVAKDHLIRLIDPDSPGTTAAPTGPSRRTAVTGAPGKVVQDPASGLAGLMWNLDRIRSPQADKINAGSPAVTVAVADTGLDYTHPELASKVSHVEDFTQTENPPICETLFPEIGGDAHLAGLTGGPQDTDWNGHGSWIGGNIAAALDGTGINGIAPRVNLVSLKISQWCGYAYDSEILAAFNYAAAQHYDVLSISFGGYLDRSDPNQDAIYQQYVSTVANARRQGTLIIAAAGNEHVRIGAGGKVLSHGSLTLPGDPLADLFGLYETPGGIPGVIDVSSTGNVVASPTAGCNTTTQVDLGGNPTCKPTSDAHQSFGVGRKDQLAYYSNYGPRIDIAGPGGARKFNLPNFEGGGTPGFPYTTDTTAYEDFSTTSNWAVDIPCFVFTGSTIFYPDACYSTIQGTSMATPHVSAVAALIASAYPVARHRPGVIAAILNGTARGGVRNTTPPLSATDTSPGDLSGVPCTTGYCHLGGPAISSGEAYGSGIVDALAAEQIR